MRCINIVNLVHISEPGIGTDTCFGTLFDVALGNVSPYFHFVAAGDQTRAMSMSLIVAMGVTLLCCVLVWLLPAHAQPQYE